MVNFKINSPLINYVLTFLVPIFEIIIEVGEIVE